MPFLFGNIFASVMLPVSIGKGWCGVEKDAVIKMDSVDSTMGMRGRNNDLIVWLVG